MAGNGVVCPNAVGGDDCECWVGFGGCSDVVDHRLCPSPGGECELVRATCCGDGFGISLGQASGHQPPEEVTNDDPPDSTIWFLQGGDASQANGTPTSGRIWALASWLATVTKDCVACSSSSTRRRVSAVRPEGPGAAPLRARRGLVRSWLVWRSGAGWWMWVGKDAAGVVSGSRSAGRVVAELLAVDELVVLLELLVLPSSEISSSLGVTGCGGFCGWWGLDGGCVCPPLSCRGCHGCQVVPQIGLEQGFLGSCGYVPVVGLELPQRPG